MNKFYKILAWLKPKIVEVDVISIVYLIEKGKLSAKQTTTIYNALDKKGEK